MRHRALVAAGVGEVVQSVVDFPEPELLLLALQTRGKVLAPGEGFCWGVLPPLVCEAAGGAAEWAYPMGTAAEFLMAAADVLDDLQDQDNPTALWHRCGPTAAMNVANLLLLLAYSSLSRLSDGGAPASRIGPALHALVQGAIRACCGQHMDISQATSPRATEEGYVAMVELKSGAPISGLCRAAALLAGDDQVEIERYARFGFNLGMALQVSNDVSALSVDAGERADLRACKATLPIVYALRFAGPADVRHLERLLARNARTPPDGDEDYSVRQMLTRCGALHYAIAIGDVYYLRALACLTRPGDGQIAGMVHTMREGK